MKRKAVIAIVLCTLMLATLGAGVAMAKQEGTQVPKFDVTFEGTPVGTLSINTNTQTFAFNGKGLTPDTTYYLICTNSKYNMGSADATKNGAVKIEGEWRPTVVDLAANPTFELRLAPPVGADPIPTRISTFKASTTQSVVNGVVTLTIHLEQWSAAKNAWILVPYETLEIQRTVNFLSQTEAGWNTLSQVKTDYYGNANLDITTPTIGWYGFKVVKLPQEPLAYSESSVRWVTCKIGTKLTASLGIRFGTIVTPFDQYSVYGTLVDQWNKPMVNQKIEIWDADQSILQYAYTNEKGVFEWNSVRWWLFDEEPDRPFEAHFHSPLNSQGVAPYYDKIVQFTF